MKDKKNIDKLFNEGFKNFEATPSPHVWENIQTELNKEKRNRKPIPLWIKYGGVAALLALLLTIGNSVFNSSEPIQNSISNENTVNPAEEIQQTQNSLETNTPEVQVVMENENTPIESTQYTRESADKIHKNQNGQRSDYKSKPTVSTSLDFESTDSNFNESQNKISRERNNYKTNSDQVIAASKTASELPSNNVEEINGTKGNQNPKLKSDERISMAKPEKMEETQIETEIQQELQNKKSLLDAIAEKEEADLDRLKNQKPVSGHRWIITPNVAPVYYSSFGSGSSISPDFSNNPQKGEVNMSIGLQVSYALSDRISIRTGVNNVDLSYSTSNILIGTGPVSMALRSVDYGSQQIVVTALSRNSQQHGVPSNGFGEITLKSSAGDARLIQDINYYEVPLELKYAVINNKLGVNLIGGLSTLFLGNNEISVKSENFSSVLGEANNLSNVSFSTNVGLGLDYKLSRRFIFNIEPMFKYQLNPYTDSTVNFKPYYLGVYSGFSFKF